MLLFPVLESHSLEARLHLLESHHWHLHLLHEHKRVHLHHLLPVFRVLVRAVHACAGLVEFANDFGVYKNTFVRVGTFREELASLRRMQVVTFSG